MKDQYSAAFKELESLRCDLSLEEANLAHAKDAITQKDQKISFLQAHISQLTQNISQFALKPGEDEITKKEWFWRFWK